MKCILCGSTKNDKRPGSVRDNKTLEILECTNCGLVFLSDKKHIDNKFYEESNMHENIDFEKWKNDTLKDDERRFNFLRRQLINSEILDFGSGNAGFLMRAKTISSYVCGVELEDAVKSYYNDNGIDLFKNLDNIDKKFDLITSFHVLEHILEPHEIINNMKNKLKDKGKIVIEVPNANDALLTIYKNEPFSHFTYWSCHLYLYTDYTLRMLAKQCDLKVDFVKFVQRYPLSNHLYWLSNGKAAGDKVWGSFIDSPQLTSAYEEQLASIGTTDTIIMQLSL